MMNENLTLGQVKGLRKELETSIAETIKNFEKETGLEVNWISANTKESKVSVSLSIPDEEDEEQQRDVNNATI